MAQLTLALDALPILREAAGAPTSQLGAAATLADLAGVGALRLGISEELRPVKEADVRELRASARRLELRMPPSQSLLKLVLETRPDLTVLASGGSAGAGPFGPIELRSRDTALVSVVRTLDEAGIASALLVSPELDAVKAAHAVGAGGVEFYTGATVDLPAEERRSELEGLFDAARLAAKLRLEIGIGGRLGFDTVGEVLAAAPGATRVVAGRALLSRSILVGVDRAVGDFRALVER